MLIRLLLHIPLRVGVELSIVLDAIVLGVCVGALQWDVLRHKFDHAQWWILATVVGWGIGLPIGIFIIGNVASVAVGLTIGAIVGIAQWLVLRRRVHPASLWIFANITTWAVSIAIIWTLMQAFGVEDGTLDLFVLPIGGCLGSTLTGLITGGVLVWLLRRSSGNDRAVSKPVSTRAA